MYQRDYYNRKVSDLVSACHKDIVDIMKENGIEKIMFYQHKDVLEEGVPMVTFNNDKAGQGQGFGVYTDSDGNRVVETDILVARLALRASEVIINQVTYTGGKRVFSAAGMVVSAVEDKGKVSYQELGEITYMDDSNLVYISHDCKFSGYTDGYYGDYFDIAQSLPKIYAAIVDIVNANDVKPNELQ